MKQIFKSKLMLLFILFILAVITINCNDNTKNVSAENTNNQIITQNNSLIK